MEGFRAQFLFSIFLMLIYLFGWAQAVIAGVLFDHLRYRKRVTGWRCKVLSVAGSYVVT